MRYLTDTHEITIDGVRVGSIRAIDLWQGRESPAQAREIVATIASLSYGNDAARNPDALYEQIVKRGHLSCLEFVPMPHLAETQPVLPAHSLRGASYDALEFEYDFDGKDSYRSIYPATGFLVECPIFVARQWMRHRSFSYLEMSRRYVKGSKVPFSFYRYETASKTTKAFYDDALALYDHLIETGEKPEVARRIIPQGAMTKFWVGGFDRDWKSSFLALRNDAHAQEEIRVFAQWIAKFLDDKTNQ